jgi:catechol 2,3-dioxygenase-like lactoylglutathione lyase family enzyme
MRQGREASGIAPNKLGHIAFNVHDVKTTVKFFTDCLGFRESDWMGDFFAFLRCGPDHHTVNMLHGQKNKMHHIAFEARDWGHIKDACDFLGKQKIPLIWGPGRHGIGHNLFIYHHTPDGQIMELYAELDQMTDEASGAFDPRPWHEDNPQKPKVWQPGPQTSNIWGIPTPQLFRD